MEALTRICDSYESLQQEEAGQAWCNLLISEFPTSARAKQIANKRSMRKPAKSYQFEDEAQEKSVQKAKPAEAAPASAGEPARAVDAY